MVRRYRRPNGFWARIINRMLGPVPEDAGDVSYQPAEFDQVPSRWPVSIVAVLVVLGGVLGLQLFVPASGTSPVTLALGHRIGDWFVLTLVTVLLIFIAVRHLTARLSFRQTMYRVALLEEKWFRLGAERWNGWQRVGSCVGFGVAHLLNLIYVLATLGMLAVAGAIFMAVYLYEFRLTADRRRAVIAAAKVHAHYNLVVLGLLVTVLATFWALMLVSVLR